LSSIGHRSDDRWAMGFEWGALLPSRLATSLECRPESRPRYLVAGAARSALLALASDVGRHFQFLGRLRDGLPAAEKTVVSGDRTDRTDRTAFPISRREVERKEKKGGKREKGARNKKTPS
jgi:hypothetical protein